MFKLLLNCILIFILSLLTLITWTISANGIVNNYNKPNIDTIYRIVSNYNEKALKYNAISSKDKKAKQILLNDIKNYLIWIKDSYAIELNELKLKWYFLSNKPKAWWKFQLIPKLKIIDNWTELLKNMSDKETTKYVQEKIKWNLDLTNKVLWTKYNSNDITGGISRTTIIWTSSHTPAEIEMNQKIKKLTIGQANLYFDYIPNVAITSKQTVWSLQIKESGIIRISEESDFKIYEAEVTSNGGDTTIDKLELTQFWIGDWVNINDVYKYDYNSLLLELTTSLNEKVYRYTKYATSSGITFDNLGIQISKDSKVTIKVRINSSRLYDFYQGKDFQKTNIFFAKYITKDWSKIEGKLPLVFSYSKCDDGIKTEKPNNFIIMNQQFIKLWDYTDYQDKGSEGGKATYSVFYPDLTDDGRYIQFLKDTYYTGILNAYRNDSTWPIYGYKSEFTNQIKPSNGVKCSEVYNYWEVLRKDFKEKYEKLLKELQAQEDRKRIDLLINVINQDQKLIEESNLMRMSQDTYYAKYMQQLKEVQDQVNIYSNCLNGKWNNSCSGYGF